MPSDKCHVWHRAPLLHLPSAILQNSLRPSLQSTMAVSPSVICSPAIGAVWSNSRSAPLGQPAQQTSKRLLQLSHIADLHMSRGPKGGAPRTTLVIDNGGGTVKLGIAGQDAPARCWQCSTAPGLLCLCLLHKRLSCQVDTHAWVQGLHQRSSQGQGRAQGLMGPPACCPAGHLQPHPAAPSRQVTP